MERLWELRGQAAPWVTALEAALAAAAVISSLVELAARKVEVVFVQSMARNWRLYVHEDYRQEKS